MKVNVKRTLTMLALFVALTANTASAQYSSRTNNQNGTYSNRSGSNSRDEVISRTDDPTVYTDERGQYHWQTVEKRVWIPEYEKSGIFGRKTIPGHYEMRTERIKIYNNGSQNNQNGQYSKPGEQGWGQHNPHGMPPGQRKKLDQNGNHNDRDYDKDSKHKKDSKGKKHDKDDRDDDDDRNSGSNENNNRQ